MGSTRPLPPQSEVGVDAGAYARQLMGNAADAADELTPVGEVQPLATQQPELSAQVGSGMRGREAEGWTGRVCQGAAGSALLKPLLTKYGTGSYIQTVWCRDT